MKRWPSISSVVAVLLWLACNLVLLARGGRQRIELDAHIGRLDDPARQREQIFGPIVGPRLRALEQALDELTELAQITELSGEPHARVAVYAPPPRNVFESLAWHRLFPAGIVALRGSGGDPVERARGQGASVLVAYGADGWRVVRLSPGPRPPDAERAR